MAVYDFLFHVEISFLFVNIRVMLMMIDFGLKNENLFLLDNKFLLVRRDKKSCFLIMSNNNEF